MGECFITRRGGGGEAVPHGWIMAFTNEGTFGDNSQPSSPRSGTIPFQTIQPPTSNFSRLYFYEQNNNSGFSNNTSLGNMQFVKKGEAANILLENSVSTGGSYVIYARLYLHVNADGSCYEYIDYATTAPSNGAGYVCRFSCYSKLLVLYI